MWLLCHGRADLQPTNGVNAVRHATDRSFSRPPPATPLGWGIEAVQAELGEVLDATELAQWLAEPNPSLCGCTPTDMLDFDPRAVLNAARLDRYIVKG